MDHKDITNTIAYIWELGSNSEVFSWGRILKRPFKLCNNFQTLIYLALYLNLVGYAVHIVDCILYIEYTWMVHLCVRFCTFKTVGDNKANFRYHVKCNSYSQNKNRKILKCVLLSLETTSIFCLIANLLFKSESE